MTDRNCIAIDVNELCVVGMLYRMTCIDRLLGPKLECGGGAALEDPMTGIKRKRAETEAEAETGSDDSDDSD